MTADVTVPPAAGSAPARWALLAGLAALTVTGSAAAWGALAVPGPARMVTAWGGAAAVASVTAAVAVAAHCADTARRGRRRVAALEAAAAGLQRQAAELAERTVPAVAQRVRAGGPAAAVLADVPQPADATLRLVLLAVTRELEEARHRSAAAMSAAAGAAARIQASATRMLADLRELENRHGDDEVFGGLLDLDHQVSQAGRLADSLALLSGGRSGRRWTKPIVMESILRGAMGRLAAYRRIRLHAASTLAVAGHAAEGVMHALAELMDNATRFSAAGTEVDVSVQEAEAGILVLIEDGGAGLHRRDLCRAEALVAGSADLSTLPGGGLGLAAVGRLAARYGLTVSFRPSPHAGTTAAVLIPRQLIVPGTPDADEAGPLSAAPVAVAVAVSASAAPVGVAPTAAPHRGGLPKRAPGRTMPAARPVPGAGPPGGAGPGGAGPGGAGPGGAGPGGAGPGGAGPGGAGPGGAGPGGAARPRDPGARFAAFRHAVGGRTQPHPAGPDRVRPARGNPDGAGPDGAGCGMEEAESAQAQHAVPEHVQSEHVQSEHVQSEHVQSEHVQSEHVQSEHVQSEPPAWPAEGPP